MSDFDINRFLPPEAVEAIQKLVELLPERDDVKNAASIFMAIADSEHPDRAAAIAAGTLRGMYDKQVSDRLRAEIGEAGARIQGGPKP
jgi:hypothetical protein